MDRIVLAYAGRFDVSVALAQLANTPQTEIVTLTLDLGQGQPLEEIRDRALASGAARAHVLDVREEFVREYVLRALRADALYQDHDPVTTALGQTLLAQKLVEIAELEHAGTIAHGLAGGARGQARLEAAVRTLDPDITIKTLNMSSNSRGGSRPASECPDEPALVEITFERGEPTAINGVAMPLVELMASLGTIAGAHGVGRLDRLDASAAAVLQAAHTELQRSVAATEAGQPSLDVSAEYAELIDRGRWFTPLRAALDAQVNAVQERVTGDIRLQLFKGDCRPATEVCA